MCYNFTSLNVAGSKRCIIPRYWSWFLYLCQILFPCYSLASWTSVITGHMLQQFASITAWMHQKYHVYTMTDTGRRLMKNRLTLSVHIIPSKSPFWGSHFHRPPNQPCINTHLLKHNYFISISRAVSSKQCHQYPSSLYWEKRSSFCFATTRFLGNQIVSWFFELRQICLKLKRSLGWSQKRAATPVPERSNKCVGSLVRSPLTTPSTSNEKLVAG